MTRHDKVANDIRLALGLLDHLLDHPADVKRIAPGIYVEFVREGEVVRSRSASIPPDAPVLTVLIRPSFSLVVPPTERAA